MYSSPSLERYPSPPPLPFQVTGGAAPVERRRVSTETSASSGWAARLAERFPERTAAKPQTAEMTPAPAPEPMSRARCWRKRIFG